MNSIPERVVAVDDSDHDIEDIQKAVSSFDSDIEFISFRSESDFLNWLNSEPADEKSTLFFIDLRMETEESGLNCVRTLRDHRVFRASIVIVVSASNYNPNIVESYHSGATLYLEKGDGPPEFSDAVVSLLSLFSKSGFLLPSGVGSSSQTEDSSSEATKRDLGQVIQEVIEQDDIRRLPLRSFRSFSSWPSFGGTLEGHSIFIERKLGNDKSEDPIDLTVALRDFFSVSKSSDPSLSPDLSSASSRLFSQLGLSEGDVQSIQQYLSESIFEDRWVITSGSPADDKSIFELLENVGIVRYFVENDAMTAFGFAFQIGASIGIVIISVGSARSIVKFVDKGFDFLADRYFSKPNVESESDDRNPLRSDTQ